jgi:hypothetical protein
VARRVHDVTAQEEKAGYMAGLSQERGNGEKTKRENGAWSGGEERASLEH